MKKLIRFAAVLGLLAPLAFAEDYIESFGDDAFVNWTRGEACATGSGIVRGEEWTPEMKIEAHRAASLDAMRKLVEVINNIHVDSETTVEEFVENSSTVHKKISGIVRNFTEREVRFTKDGICQVDIYIPINGDGSISDIFLGQADVPRVADFQDGKVSVSPGTGGSLC